MFRVFEADSASEAWQNVATALAAEDGFSLQTSRKGATREILHAAISVSDPRQRWAVSRTPVMNIAFALAEVIWIMAGRNDSAFLNYYNSELPKYCGTGSTYHGAYGHRLRKRFHLDQIARAFEALRTNPDTRQVVLQIWDSAVDLPGADGKPASEDVPCNIVAMLKVRNQRLEWTQIMRSNDIFRGLPYNFVQFTTIQEIIAGWLGVSVGTYNHISDSLHAYDSDLAKFKSTQTAVAENNPDSLALSKNEFDLVFAELEKGASSVTDQNVSADSLANMVANCRLPEAYRNILCVLSAEGVRRRKQEEHLDRIMTRCTNPVFAQLYSRWVSRLQEERSVCKP